MRRESDKEIYYEDYSISVTPKNLPNSNALTLSPAAYRWKIRAVDENGATISTGEKLLLVKTHNGSFTNGNSNLPLSLTYLGYSLNISNLDPNHVLPSYTIYTTTPTLSGITYSDYIINLSLTDTKTNKEVLSKQTTSQNSRFGINITNTDKLTTGEYLVKLTASNTDNYVELPSFNLVISRGGNGSSVKKTQVPASIPPLAGSTPASAAAPTPIKSGPTAKGGVTVPPASFSITSFLKNLLHF